MLFTDAEDFNSTLLNAPIGICILDADTLVAEIVNDKFLEVAGKPYEAIYGRYYWDAFAEARPYYEAALAGVIQTGEAYYADQVELMLIRYGEPEMIFVTFVYAPIKDKAGKVKRVAVWVLENTRQVAERKREEVAKNAFKVERDQLYSYFMQAAAGICVLHGPDLVYELVNPAYQQILPGRELSGRPIFEALPELVGSSIQEMLLKVYNEGESWEMSEVMIPVSEYEGGPTKERYFSFSFQARRDEHNHIDGIVNFVFEVTDMIRVQEELLKAREGADQQRRVYEAITSGTPDLMYVFDLEYRFTYANSALLTMWGKTWDTAIGKGLRENGYEEWHAAMHEREIDHIRATKESVRGEVAFPHAVLGKRIYDYILIPVLNEAGEVEAVAGTTRDVTERKQMEQALAQGTEDLQAINEELLAANEEQVASNEELIATNEELAIVNQQLLEAQQKIEDGEVALRMAIESGELATWFLNEKLGVIEASPRFNEMFGFKPEEKVSYDAMLSQILPEYRQMVEHAFATSFKTGSRFNVEYPITGVYDGKQRWMRSVGKFVADEKQGNYITGVMADITEQKMDELRKNDFIGMVSHELKTPLTSMKGYIQMLQRLNQQNKEFSAGMLEKANSQVGKMTAMVNSFLNVSRLESGKIYMDIQEFDMARLMAEVEEESRATISSHVLVFNPVKTMLVNGDWDKIEQVIHNLISNAVKYSPAHSMIEVSCFEDGGMVNVSVKDRGMGIKPDDLLRIFDRYYRVEGSQMFSISGFGIGLYICKEIIQRHMGEISAESVFGSGSTFTFSLPLIDME
ncbi:PAS domain-containing protein [Pedobacter sp.]|jgi:PAS domain S-box-containing protein|uniref:PAS domain-containing protein n=1 Tax=Pedobacter sp. TaxID=1411316 RepID=UPI002BFE5BCB|nr:PAS domain-containing protein [Pedobacter sp.]HWW43288.1 PAS domain-containing protein [Pedobacter sp.]